MSINEKGMNDDYVSYFPLEEYVKQIELLPYVLEHLKKTSKDFDSYREALDKYDTNYIVDYWMYSLYDELEASQQIENASFNARALADKSLMFDTLTISHRRIHELHNFVTDGEYEPTFSYRSVPVNVSRINTDGSEDIFWRGVNPEDVGKFMNDFIKIYKHNGIAFVYSNPFLSSALMHLLFVRIHPYIDGNGRTARMIQNIKFTEMINKLCGTRLKLSPLNLSGSILVNKGTYAKTINQIYFDLEHDTNNAINEWFDFILNMVDEQIYFSQSKLENAENPMMKISTDNTAKLNVRSNAVKMRVSRF